MQGRLLDAAPQGDNVRRTLLDVPAELLEALGVGGDVVAIDPALADQDMGQAVEEHEVGFGLDGQVQGRGHRRFRLPWIDHDDLRPMGIAADPVPENGVGDA